jgi:hypothetical protein
VVDLVMIVEAVVGLSNSACVDQVWLRLNPAKGRAESDHRYCANVVKQMLFLVTFFPVPTNVPR